MTLNCAVELRRGDVHAAVRLGQQAVSAGAAAGSPLARTARVQLAEALLEIDEPARARALLVGGEEELVPPLLPMHEALGYELLTRAELALDRPDEAHRYAERASESARARAGLRLPSAQAMRAHARVALANGRSDAAVSHASEAASAAEQAGAALDAARGRILLARALA